MHLSRSARWGPGSGDVSVPRGCEGTDTGASLDFETFTEECMSVCECGGEGGFYLALPGRISS